MLRQGLSFFAGAAAATLVADAALIAASGAMPRSDGLVHHVEFLATLIVLVGLAGAMGLQMPPRRAFTSRALVMLGAIAALLGFAIGVAVAPMAGETASILAIVICAGAVPVVASRWHRGDAGAPP